MAKWSIIDLGTNTFNLLVVEIDEKRNRKTLYQEKIPVRLGEGGINAGIIQDEPFRRGLKAMEQFAKKNKELQTDTIFAFATSAIRSSTNGKLFTKTVKEICGIEIQIIDGDTEAELIFEGVRLSGILGPHTSLILDIGGGSCEFILCNQEGIFWKKSYDLGVARLFERFRHQNPISLSEIKALESLFTITLTHLFEALKSYPTTELIGSSGSFDSFAEMISFKIFGEDRVSNLPAYTFSIPEYQQIHQQLLHSTLEERFQIPGLVAMRADMIVIASILVNYLIQQISINSMKVSAYALKEGMMEKCITNNLNH